MTVNELPVPAATRLQRPRWRDPRLVIGVVLVCASVTLGSITMNRADERFPVYAARTALVPGQRLSDADLSRVDVQLGAARARYVSARSPLGADRFVLSEVRPGELVPATAVGGRGEVGVQPVTVSVEAGSAATLVVGSQVDVYVNPLAGGTAGAGGSGDGQQSRRSGTYAGPEVTLRSVAVAGLPRQGGALGGGSGLQPVQIMVPTEAIRDLIATVDQGSRVTLVPVPGAVLESSR